MQNPENYSVKAVKTFEGMEGYGFNANLYRNNKKVARVIDSADGGCYFFNFDDPAEEKLLDDMCAKLPAVTSTLGGNQAFTYQPDSDTFFNDLVCDYEHKKWAKRACKGKTLFRLVDDKPDTWQVSEIPFSPKLKTALVAKFGNKLESILNETI